MAQVVVRNLQESVVRALKKRAELHGNSLEQELREILVGAAGFKSEELTELSKMILAMTPDIKQSDSTLLIREDRDR